eukprot:1561107-Rhodomonas_salina.1
MMLRPSGSRKSGEEGAEAEKENNGELTKESVADLLRLCPSYAPLPYLLRPPSPSAHALRAYPLRRRCPNPYAHGVQREPHPAEA